MFAQKDESKLQLTQLQLIVSLIKEKYNIGANAVESRITNDPATISIVLLNGLSGADSLKVDTCNARPIEFLKAHGGEVTKEAHEDYSYWSYSVVTLKKEMLSQIIDGLNVLPTPNHEREDRMMARC